MRALHLTTPIGLEHRRLWVSGQSSEDSSPRTHGGTEDIVTANKRPEVTRSTPKQLRGGIGRKMRHFPLQHKLLRDLGP